VLYLFFDDNLLAKALALVEKDHHVGAGSQVLDQAKGMTIEVKAGLAFGAPYPLGLYQGAA
jgi:hypothetical protein